MAYRSLPVLLLALTAPVFSQSFTPVRELKNLSPAAIEKLHTLDTLNALPGGDWHFHAGDIPHGESPTLDDSAWTVVTTPAPRKSVKASKDAVWYRRVIEVPKTLNGYDISGSRIWFQFEADANGPMPEIVYFNGRRVALGDDLEPIILFEPAKPGDKILVAVKLLHTVDDKTWRGVDLRVETDPSGTSKRLSPDDIRTQIITAANLLPALPTPRKDLLPKVEEAAAAVDTQALAAANQAAFDASLRKAQAILSTLHDTLAQAKVDLTGNAHIDAAWLWPRSETIDVVRRTFTTALQLMDEYPDYTYTQSAAQYNEWMADKYPDLNAQIKQRVKEGRWELVGGMWVEPDLNLPGGESLVRQLLLGQRYFQKEYGVTTRIGWNPDSFGYNWQLPQIYKRSGMDYFVTQKMHWNDTNQLPFRLFWWESPDGSKVLTYFPTDYVHENVNPTRISADFAESAMRNPGTMEHLDLYGIGDHGGGPTRTMLDQADKWIAAGARYPESSGSSAAPATSTRYPEPSGSGLTAAGGSGALAPEAGLHNAAVPTMRYSTAQNFFTNIEQNLNPNSPTWNYDSIAKGYTPPPASATGAVGLPTWHDELYFEYHRGVQTTQANHKRNMRRSEAATLDAEKYASLAWLNGQPYPNDVLTENWKKITFNQFHDLAAGSGIAVIYRDAQKDYTEVSTGDREILQTSLRNLADRIDTAKLGGPGVQPILISNSIPWERNSIVQISLQPGSGLSKMTVPGARWEFVTDGKGDLLMAQIISVEKKTNTLNLLIQADVPSLGYTVVGDLCCIAGAFHEKASDLRLFEDKSTFSLANSHLTAVIEKTTGCVTQLHASEKNLKPANYFLAGSCGNQLQAFADNPKNYDAWNIDPGTLDKAPTIIDKVDSVSVIADGPLRKTIRVQRTWQKSHFTQDISLDAGSDFVRVETTVDWHEDHVLLKAAFPLAATSGKATFEIPYGSIQRPTTRNNSWEKAQFEVPAQQWADLGDDKQGVSIINDSKYGYDALGNTLRLTLLRSPTWPDPDADRGVQHFVYEIYPHQGRWQDAQTVRRGYELNNPLHAEQAFAHTGSLPPTHSFVSLDAPNVTLTAMKKAEDADALIFRMYEWAGKATEVKLHIPAGASYAVETNLMEKPEGPHLALTGDTITVTIKPFEILTVQAVYPSATANAVAAAQ